MVYFASHLRVEPSPRRDRLGDRANLLLLASAWLLSRLLSDASLLLCLLGTNHLVQMPNVVQETKADVNAKNLMRREVNGQDMEVAWGWGKGGGGIWARGIVNKLS